MTQKKRILMVGESSHIPSGFGNYTREILSRLYKTNKYEIAELSCYRHSGIPKTEPWKIYPVSVLPNDPLYKEFIQNPNNRYGQWRFDLALLHFKPDIVVDVRDFWNFAYQEVSTFRKFFKWVVAPTYDSDPPKIDSFNTFKNVDVLSFHTEWARNKYLSYNDNIKTNAGPVVSDSVDSEIFKPIDTDKNIHKMIFGLPSDSFIIGTVMRNQKRKLVPDLFEITKKLIEECPDKQIILYLHSSFPEQNGWNIPALLIEYGLENHVYLTYKCKKCRNYWASTYQHNTSKCSCGGDATICSLLNGLSQNELNNIYNLFDIYIQYAICEGFGIPQVEAASAGLPLITIDHGAMAEVGNKLNAHIVPISKEFKELETEAFRVYPNNDQCIKIIKNLINLPKIELLNQGLVCRKKLLENYSWAKTAKIFEEIFDNIDISTNIKWNIPLRSVNTSLNINSSDSNRDFVYKIVDNVILDQHLKYTPFIEEIILNLDNGMIIQDNKTMVFDRNHAIKILENYLNTKIALEKIRTNQAQFSELLHTFLNY